MALALVLALLLAGCASQLAPDTLAPVVLTKVETVELPVAAPREVPPELTAPLGLDMPEFQDCPADYGMSRANVLRQRRLIAAFARYRQLCKGFAEQ